MIRPALLCALVLGFSLPAMAGEAAVRRMMQEKDDLMLRDIEPTAKPDCDTPVEKLVALGRKLGANSTPTWFLRNGERYQGALPVDEVTRLLDAASSPKR